jgi:hypothetical protein
MQVSAFGKRDFASFWRYRRRSTVCSIYAEGIRMNEVGGLKRHFGTIARLIAFYAMTALITATGFSAWRLLSYQPLDEPVFRFFRNILSIFSFSIFLSPLIVPSALLGGAIIWFPGRLAGLSLPARHMVAGGGAGLAAVLPIAITSWRGDAEGVWHILVLPLLCIAPVAGAISAAIIWGRH